MNDNYDNEELDELDKFDREALKLRRVLPIAAVMLVIAVVFVAVALLADNIYNKNRLHEESEKMTSMSENDDMEVESISENDIRGEIETKPETENESETETMAQDGTNAEAFAEPIYALITSPGQDAYMAEGIIYETVQPLKMDLISETPNNIIDESEWFIENELLFPAISGNFAAAALGGKRKESGLDEDLTAGMYGLCFYDENYVYSVNNSGAWDESVNELMIYDRDTFQTYFIFDFSDFCKSGWNEISWASLRGDILYVSIWHNGYAQPNSCYITAIDTKTMDVLWKTDSLVCNSKNFLIVDDIILCGYGFTAEPDYIYQVNINSGQVVDKTPIKTMADYLVLKDNKLYVRCYDTDYIFEIK